MRQHRWRAPVFMDYITTQNEYRGQRCRDINLCVLNFQTDGIFKKEVQSPGLIWITQRFTGIRRLAHNLPGLVDDTASNFTLDNNWSEIKCKVVDKTGQLAPKRITELFADQSTHILNVLLSDWQRSSVHLPQLVDDGHCEPNPKRPRQYELMDSPRRAATTPSAASSSSFRTVSPGSTSFVCEMIGDHSASQASQATDASAKEEEDRNEMLELIDKPAVDMPPSPEESPSDVDEAYMSPPSPTE